MHARYLVAVVLLVLASACAGADQPRSDPPSGQLEVRCDGVETLIMTPVVQAQADGVHVLIHNVSGAEVLTQWEHGGDGAPAGDSQQLISIPPDNARFRCQAMTDDIDPGAPGGWEAFEVLEPPGWVSPDLGCTRGVVTGHIDHVVDAKGVGDPQADASDRAGGAEVVRAGYAGDETRAYVVLDGGVAAMSFTYFDDERGGWLLMETSRCQ